MHFVQYEWGIGKSSNAQDEHDHEPSDIFDSFVNHGHVERQLWEQSHPVVEEQPLQNDWNAWKLDQRVLFHTQIGTVLHHNQQRHDDIAPEDLVPHITEVLEFSFDYLIDFNQNIAKDTNQNVNSQECLEFIIVSGFRCRSKEINRVWAQWHIITEVEQIASHEWKLWQKYFQS